MKRGIAIKERMEVSDMATIYGCCGLFDLCSDADLVSLSLQGADPFLDWIGWQATLDCIVKKSFIAWNRPEYYAGAATSGYLTDPCAEPSSVEFGVCDFTLEDFARLRRKGPVRDVTYNAVNYCKTAPRYRLDGTAISDDREYDARVIAEIVLQDLRRMLITGAGTAGTFAGLESLVQTGYANADGSPCRLMDSMVIDWNGHGLNGGAGITFNGAAMAAGFTFIDVLLDVYRRMRTRVSWSPSLAAQPFNIGDVVLAMPTHMIRCLLDAYTCWSVCEGTQYNEVEMQSFEARQFRTQLNGGMFGDGRIFLDGFEIPIVHYDWELIKGPTLSDIYMLVGQIGSVKTLMGEYNDMNVVPRDFPEADYFSTDGGRFLGWLKQDETCYTQTMEFRPRLVSWAPWTNARFQNVRCTTPTGPMSPDPTETSFFPETSFTIAEC